MAKTVGFAMVTVFSLVIVLLALSAMMPSSGGSDPAKIDSVTNQAVNAFSQAGNAIEEENRQTQSRNHN